MCSIWLGLVLELELGFGWGLELGLGYLVSVFTLFLSFTRSLCGSPMLCCCLLFEFIVYTIQTLGGGVAVQYTNCLCVCVCAVLFAKFIDLETICVCCLSFLGLSMIFFGIPAPDTTTHTAHIYTLDISQEIIVFGFTL